MTLLVTENGTSVLYFGLKGGMRVETYLMCKFEQLAAEAGNGAGGFE